MRSFLRPSVHFLDHLPAPAQVCDQPHNAVVIFDEVLLNKNHFQDWLSKFGFSYPVQAGEKLKDAHDFPNHLERVASKISQISRKSCTVIAVGGGSVGDFAGFFASTYKRGVPIVHIPTTWLAAIDSAHGGKTALNLGAAKNQIGSFHFCERIFICQNFFKENFLQVSSGSQSGVGELIKMALLSGTELWGQLTNYDRLDIKSWWDLLPLAIEAKYHVVEQDPFEQTQTRQILNLGHSFGHVLENKLRYSHGECVLQGLFFSLAWSQNKGFLPSSTFNTIYSYLNKHSSPRKEEVRASVTNSLFKELLMADKKLNHQHELDFVFLKEIGHPYILSVSIKETMAEVKRQGWVN